MPPTAPGHPESSDLCASAGRHRRVATRADRRDCARYCPALRLPAVTTIGSASGRRRGPVSPDTGLSQKPEAGDAVPPSSSGTGVRTWSWAGYVPGMAAVIKSVTFDAADALALATFWAAVFGSDVDEDSTTGKAFVEAAGWGGPNIWFTQIPETKTAKNRMHFDLRAPGPVRAEVACWRNSGPPSWPTTSTTPSWPTPRATSSA